MDTPATRPTISVVICAHTMERRSDLEAAVASVAAQIPPVDELILVVDHNDELLRHAEKLADVVVPNTGPRGLSGARNTGTARARGDVVAYLDDDATADPGWLAALADPFRDERVVAVGGRAVPAWDAEPPSWFPAEYLWVVGCSHRGLPEVRAEVRNVIGCTMAFRRDAVLAAGGFDAGLGRTADRPLGCEETELCIRLRRADPTARIVLEPAAVVHHRVPAERTRWRYFVARCRAEGASKAHVVGLVGSGDGLSSERSYVTSVLPRAVGRAIADLPRDPGAEFARVLALTGGLVATAAGYAQHRLRAAWSGRGAARPGAHPARRPVPSPVAGERRPLGPASGDRELRR